MAANVQEDEWQKLIVEHSSLFEQGQNNRAEVIAEKAVGSNHPAPSV
ncbi:hypothetical protein [Methyloglobulus sp.]